jgi:hypothetical protein
MNSKRLMGISFVVLLLVLGSAVGCSRSRSDQQIVTDIQAKLYGDPNVPSRQIEVQSNNGVVTLSGTVGSDPERTAAANDASQVEGAKSVVNNLQVTPAAVASSERRSAEPTAPRRVARSASRSTGGIVIAEGTELTIRMIDSIDSDKNKVGDTFRGSLEVPIEVNGQVVVPKGADVEGRVVESKSAGHFTGRSDIALELTGLRVNGRSYALQTDQYSRQGASRGKRTAETVGGGAAIGAIISGIAGHGKGAAIGAAAGAGAGTAVQAITKGQQIHIPSESVLSFRLTTSLAVRP